MVKPITKRKILNELKKRTKTVSETDIKTIIDKGEEIESKFKSDGPLGKFIEDFNLLISLVKDYYNGSYRKIPFWSIAAVVAALLYVLSPVDLIPDFIPVIGYVDDALIVAACLKMIEQDLNAYKDWKQNQK